LEKEGMKTRIYLTHCSAKKNISLKESMVEVTPDSLYTATPTQRFMEQCKQTKVNWAIFSDKYGVWFGDKKHKWYEKNPSKITEKEFELLIKDFETKLKKYDEIWFYYNPGRFHRIYKELLRKSKLSSKITPFTHLKQIED
jgi:hypothetical protein